MTPLDEDCYKKATTSFSSTSDLFVSKRKVTFPFFFLILGCLKGWYKTLIPLLDHPFGSPFWTPIWAPSRLPFFLQKIMVWQILRTLSRAFAKLLLYFNRVQKKGGIDGGPVGHPEGVPDRGSNRIQMGAQSGSRWKYRRGPHTGYKRGCTFCSTPA